MAKNTKAKKTKAQEAHKERVYSIIINLVILSLLTISVFKFGIFGIFTDKVVRYFFGEFHVVVFLLLISVCVIKIVKPTLLKLSKGKYLGIFFLFIAYLLLSSVISSYKLDDFHNFSYFIANSNAIFNYEDIASGGIIGVFLYSLFDTLFDPVGTYIITGSMTLIGLLLVFGTKIFNVFKFKMPEFPERERKEKRKKKIKPVINETVPYEIEDIKTDVKKERSSLFITVDENLNKQEKTVSAKSTKQITMDIDEVKKEPYQVGGKAYELPSLNLLDTKILSQTSTKNRDAAQVKGEHLIEVLSKFNIESELVDIHIGPSVTKFEIRPDTSVKVSRINSISDNIKMELSAKSIRIEAPIPGKNTVGIEIPNVENTPVKLYELIKDMPANEPPLLFTLGKDLMGNIIYSDLTKMPHLLIAGATGAGKSVALNAIIATILLRTTPEEVRMLLIDPKKVEFNSFQSAPHLMCPIINEPSQANAALMKIVEMMDERYKLFASINVKNIKGYNEYRELNPEENLNKLELLVVIIDELADLMIVAGKEVELSIQRITQLARASGIHLIVATQRPSTDVITGVIKSNIPSRISFAVSSGIDSRTILDTVGAEKLLGNGDMLYYPVGYSAPVRLQGVYVSDSEVAKIAEFVGKQPGPDHFDQFNFDESGDFVSAQANFEDALYDDIKAFVIREQKASTSLIQRSFGIGYNRAARIIDALEMNGIIGPMSGSKPREVFIADLEELEF